MKKTMISSILLGTGLGGFGSMIGIIWGRSYGQIALGAIIGTVLGICLDIGIMIMKYEIMEAQWEHLNQKKKK